MGAGRGIRVRVPCPRWANTGGQQPCPWANRLATRISAGRRRRDPWSDPSSDAPCAAKRGEGEDGHHECIDGDECENPDRRTMLPFLPDDEYAVDGEYAKERAGEFVKKLAGDAPEDAQRDDA